MNHSWTELNMVGEDTDVGGDDVVDDLDEKLRNKQSEFSGKSRNDKFSQIMKGYETPLFSGCRKEHNKLHVVLTFLQMKASNGWSDQGFNELL
jgi:vacuolar-type H+-ATPase subunit B/Vma2